MVVFKKIRIGAYWDCWYHNINIGISQQNGQFYQGLCENTILHATKHRVINCQYNYLQEIRKIILLLGIKNWAII